jgi:phosphoglycolate phosphatase
MLVVFDWDGTLIDSTGKIIACMQQAARDCGIAVLEDDPIRNIIGLGLPQAIHALYPDTAIELRKDLQTAYSRAFLDSEQEPSRFFPGVEEGLQQLLGDGCQIAVATGKSRKGLDRILHGMGLQDFFTATRCADETSSKPHPRMLIELMHELGYDSSEVWMVGDTEYDLEMAARICVKSIGVSYGAHAPERLWQHSPIAVVDEFPAVTPVVFREYPEKRR